uniref:Uncharacterized protein n=1 Tax=Globisporangium ultimum (strain ATCC 200006 / CBS 805.95 / DAOM BR144) TaxID=431595 RepID=K3W998_GLOUD
MTLPTVSIPSESGVTSTSKSELVASLRMPDKMAPCTAAPYATASSGLIDFESSLPLNRLDSMVCTLGIRVEPPTSTNSVISSGFMLASANTFSTVSSQRLKSSSPSDSNLARVTVALKSTPSKSESTSTEADVVVDNMRLADSQAVRKRRMARADVDGSKLRFLRLNSVKRYSTMLLSKSSPPKCVSPPVDLTSKIPFSIDKIDTSKVPPPRSKINTLVFWPLLPAFVSRPYARAAAVGSLIIRLTSRPAMAPASLVD